MASNSLSMVNELKSRVGLNQALSTTILLLGALVTLAGGAAEKPVPSETPTIVTDGPAWQSGFHLPGLDGRVTDAVLFDDGSGTALYVVGYFTSAGDVVANSIARWDGVSWSTLGEKSNQAFIGSATSIEVFDDGSGPTLYVGGFLRSPDNTENLGIVKWDGFSWKRLGGPANPGADGSVRDLAVYNDGSGNALFVGGNFETAGGITVNRVAKWDGARWSALGDSGGVGVDGFSEHVHALAVYDDGSGPGLFVAGSFANAGGVASNSIAKWNGAQWSAIGFGPTPGIEGSVYDLAVFNDGEGSALYVGGWFRKSGGVGTSNVSRWNGVLWSRVGGTAIWQQDDSISSLEVHDDGSGPALYVGGSFNAIDGVNANGIARWNGTDWSELNGPLGTGVGPHCPPTPRPRVSSLTSIGAGSATSLVVGGSFWTAGGVVANHIASWNREGWSALGTTGGAGVDFEVSATIVHDDGTGPRLFAGGSFTTAGGLNVQRVARWDGKRWTALKGPVGTGTIGEVLALATFDDGTDPVLVAGGNLQIAGGRAVGSIASWDGEMWAPLGDPSMGPDGPIYALAMFDDGTGPALYAGGRFAMAGGRTVNNIAKWDGLAWSALGDSPDPGTNSDVLALAVFDDGSGPALFAGGHFTKAGGQVVKRISKWDGIDWSPLGGPSHPGTDSTVMALAVIDGESGSALYVGGQFLAAGDLNTGKIARWDGSDWSSIYGPISFSPEYVSALAVIQEDSGPTLFAGGDFRAIRQNTMNNIAKWDGSNWSALTGPNGIGVNSNVNNNYQRVNALAIYNDESGPALFVGGRFNTAGGLASTNIAVYSDHDLNLGPPAPRTPSGRTPP